VNNRMCVLVGFAAFTFATTLSTPALAREGAESSLDLSVNSISIAPNLVSQDLDHSSLVAQRFPVIEFPPDGSVPSDGTFLGQGIAQGSKFSIGRQADAVLNFSNQNSNFSISIAATVASDLEMMYQGTIVRKTTGTRGINSFILETQVDSFVTSLNDYQIFDATGTCRIEVFNSLVLASDCRITDAPAMPVDLLEPGLSSQFFGVAQF